jgi:hypothetical protein
MAKQGYFFHSGVSASALFTACLDVNMSVSHSEKSISTGKREKQIIGRCIVASIGKGDKR